MNKTKAFSIIEASIVILIVAVLIVGISKGLELFSRSKLSSAQNLTKNAPVTAIDNLILWLEPTLDGSLKNQNGSEEIDDGDNVSAWTDVNPTNSSKILIIQNNSLYQPKYVRNGVNGLPSVRFDHTNNNQRLTQKNIFTGKNYDNTYFVVLKWYNSNSTNKWGQVLDFGANDVNGSRVANLLSIYPSNATSPNNVNSVSSSVYSAYLNSNSGVNSTAANTVKSNQTLMLTVFYDSQNNISRLYFGKTVVTTSSAGFAGKFYPRITDDIAIGNHVSVTRTIGADIAEIIIYDRALADEEIDSIQTYLMKKYNIN